MSYCVLFCILYRKEKANNRIAIPWTIIFPQIPSAKMMKYHIPQGLMVPQYRTLKSKLPKYHMKKSPIPQYRKPPCPLPNSNPEHCVIHQACLSIFTECVERLISFCLMQHTLFWRSKFWIRIKKTCLRNCSAPKPCQFWVLRWIAWRKINLSLSHQHFDTDSYYDTWSIHSFWHTVYWRKKLWGIFQLFKVTNYKWTNSFFNRLKKDNKLKGKNLET